ncbi:MAG: lysylphosphatidylglycerol synthase transmembrane domain-containing protein [Planctomycetota bacterium]|jgi:uncharacterized membrane protein YbhN (UPF0104 family)|nr:lysylphosphatidylglycerol synthase transmembrane domain-containing protein [Planctomycetota bacterium]
MALRFTIWALALFFFGLALRRAGLELSKSEVPLDWKSVRWSYWVLSVFFGAVALVPPCIAWQAILRDFGQSVHWADSMYAYFLGHFGKYVPGKAMAVLLRVSELHRHGVIVRPAIVSVFIETLTSIATGAILGAVLVQWIECSRWFQLSALAGIPGALLVICPQPFRFIVGWIAKSRIGNMPESVVRAIDAQLMNRTVLWSLLGWLLQGTSLWLVLQSLVDLQPASATGLEGLHSWIVCVASMSLGALAGFLSMLPGGALARELASISILLSIVPEPIALIATIVVRLTSIVAELSMIALSKWIQYRYAA